MNEHEKALIAAQTIREYCETRPNGACIDCVFKTQKNQECGDACALTDFFAPYKWNLAEAGAKIK